MVEQELRATNGDIDSRLRARSTSLRRIKIGVHEAFPPSRAAAVAYEHAQALVSANLHPVPFHIKRISVSTRSEYVSVLYTVSWITEVVIAIRQQSGRTNRMMGRGRKRQSGGFIDDTFENASEDDAELRNGKVSAIVSRSLSGRNLPIARNEVL